MKTRLFLIALVLTLVASNVSAQALTPVVGGIWAPDKKLLFFGNTVVADLESLQYLEKFEKDTPSTLKAALDAALTAKKGNDVPLSEMRKAREAVLARIASIAKEKQKRRSLDEALMLTDTDLKTAIHYAESKADTKK